EVVPRLDVGILQHPQGRRIDEVRRGEGNERREERFRLDVPPRACRVGHPAFTVSGGLRERLPDLGSVLLQRFAQFDLVTPQGIVERADIEARAGEERPEFLAELAPELRYPG